MKEFTFLNTTDIAPNACILEFSTLAVPTPMQAKLSEACTLPRTRRAVW